MDVTRPEAVWALIDRERPAVVFHAAAYTAVDAAEDEKARAEAVNARGAANVAVAVCRTGSRMVYLSSDFVFDGAQGHPYLPGDRPNPLSVYGRTKQEGELAVVDISRGAAVVLRTSWVYSNHGRNFVGTMLRLMRERDEVGVVSDQVGTPTWARSLARALWAIAEEPTLHGVHHWTDAGVASWYDLAVAVQEEALGLGLLDRQVLIRPLRTDEYPTRAQRPSYSVLDSSATRAALGFSPPHWRVNLRSMLLGWVHA
jgi:dTDP-4-dehydrorhamnose reductase